MPSFLRHAALMVGLGAMPALAPTVASAGALYTLSGIIETGQTGGNVFGLPDGSFLDGRPFSAQLRIGAFLPGGEAVPPGPDDSLLAFDRAELRVTIAGVTETIAVDSLAIGSPFTLEVFNGFNPRPGFVDGPFDDLFLQIAGATATGLLLFDLALLGDEEAVPGGAPGAPFSVVTNSSLIFGSLFVTVLIGPNDVRGFEFEASEFALALVSVPAPGSIALLGAGLLGLASLAQRPRGF